jgi:ABC-2 type transport system ATP-binding protein
LLVESIVACKGLTKRFGKILALDSLDLEMRGKVLGLIGPNGAGKTTLINILLGYTRPDVGEISVLGFDVKRELMEIKKRVGILPEKPGFPTSFSGMEFLTRVARLRGISNPEKEVKGTLEEVGLTRVAERAIRTYSSGMGQRLGLAQALVGEPELVILDEPAANLDPLGRMDVLELVSRFSRDRNVKFLISTHILYDVERTCDWIGIMDAGKVGAQGSVEELIRKYSGLTYRIAVSDPKTFGAELVKASYVRSVEFHGDAVTVTVEGEVNVYEKTMELAKRVNVTVHEVRPALGSLDDVFRAVVRPE